MMSLSHRRVAWYPMGLYNEQKRARSRRLVYTVITVCLMAGTVALVVSWLLGLGFTLILIFAEDFEAKNKCY